MGEISDWEKILERCKELAKRFRKDGTRKEIATETKKSSKRSAAESDFFGDWWLNDVIVPVMTEFVKAARSESQDEVNVLFWKSVCNIFGLSGGWSNYVTGRVQCFFPYQRNGSRNRYCSEWMKNFRILGHFGGKIPTKEELRDKGLLLGSGRGYFGQRNYHNAVAGYGM